MDTPVLIAIFNRPDKVRALIAALAKVQPRYLYVLADGPRKSIPSDIDKCAEARRIVTNVPWECEIKTHFKETNIGLNSNIVEGIDWFFNQVEAGIILEDDCLPGPSFFNFCVELLEYYKDDKEIMHISGNNFQEGRRHGDGSYYFSHYSHSWGWATWRRAWKKYHEAVANFPEYDRLGRINELPFTSTAKKFWIKHLRNNETWDGRWLYTTWYAKGLCILPNQNLVSNIGFDAEATHTTDITAQANVAINPITTIVHPSSRTVSTVADDYTFKAMFYVPIWKRVVSKLSAIITQLWK